MLQTYADEVRVYRRKPAFWLSCAIALILSLVLVRRVGGTEWMILLPLLFSWALVYDTACKHYCRRILDLKRLTRLDMTTEATKAEPRRAAEPSSAGAPEGR